LSPCEQNLLRFEVKSNESQRSKSRKHFTESKFVVFQRQSNAITLDARFFRNEKVWKVIESKGRGTSA